MRSNNKFYKRYGVEPDIEGYISVRGLYAGKPTNGDTSIVQLSLRDPKGLSDLSIELNRHEALAVAMEILGIVHRQDEKRIPKPSTES